jgi:hypothetical protein
LLQRQGDKLAEVSVSVRSRPYRLIWLLQMKGWLFL